MITPCTNQNLDLLPGVYINGKIRDLEKEFFLEFTDSFMVEYIWYMCRMKF